MQMDSGSLSTIQSFGLFSAVIGVLIGWVLSQLTETAKWFLSRKRRLEDERRARVLEYLRLADEGAALANGIGVAYAAKADGRVPDDKQFMMMVNAFNDAFSGLERIRVEAIILGPDWLATEAVTITNHLQLVQKALRGAETGQTNSEFVALLDAVDIFRTAREVLLARAKVEIG